MHSANLWYSYPKKLQINLTYKHIPVTNMCIIYTNCKSKKGQYFFLSIYVIAQCVNFTKLEVSSPVLAELI